MKRHLICRMVHMPMSSKRLCEHEHFLSYFWLNFWYGFSFFGLYFNLSLDFDPAVRYNGATLANRKHSISTKGIYQRLMCLTWSFKIRSNLTVRVTVHCSERTYRVTLTQWTHNTHKGNFTENKYQMLIFSAVFFILVGWEQIRLPF